MNLALKAEITVCRTTLGESILVDTPIRIRCPKCNTKVAYVGAITLVNHWEGEDTYLVATHCGELIYTFNESCNTNPLWYAYMY